MEIFIPTDVAILRKQMVIPEIVLSVIQKYTGCLAVAQLTATALLLAGLNLKDKELWLK